MPLRGCIVGDCGRIGISAYNGMCSQHFEASVCQAWKLEPYVTCCLVRDHDGMHRDGEILWKPVEAE